MTRIFYTLLALATPLLSSEENWPAWRGFESNGYVKTKEPIKKELGDDSLLWVYDLPGRGGSTPVVRGDRVYVTCPAEGKDSVLCLGLDGKKLWQHSFETADSNVHRHLGGGSNPSPVCDEERVYVYYKSGTLAAFSLDGKAIWEKNIQKKHGEDVLKWDLGSSPILAGGLLIVTVMHTNADSFLLALDPATGEQKWKVLRNMDTAEISGDGYATPIVREIDGVKTIVVWGADHLTGHDLGSGKLLWKCAGFNPEKKGNLRTVTSIVATDGIALVTGSRGKFVTGVPFGEKEISWKKILGSDVATPVAHDGRFYVLVDRGKDRGTIHCLEAKTGDSLWEAKLPRSTKGFYSSPLMVNDRLYCVREDGVVFSGQVEEDGLKNVKEYALEDKSVASPISVGNKLIIRGDEKLHCFSL